MSLSFSQVVGLTVEQLTLEEVLTQLDLAGHRPLPHVLVGQIPPEWVGWLVVAACQLISDRDSSFTVLRSYIPRVLWSQLIEDLLGCLGAPWLPARFSQGPHSSKPSPLMVNLVPSLLQLFPQIQQVPWALTLGELKDPPAGCGANTWITFLLDLFFEIPNLARFLSDDSKSPVPLSNLLTSPRVTQKPKKDGSTTFSCEWYKAPLCGQEN